MKKVVIGDVFVLSTNKGLVYLQFANIDALGVEYVRVLYGLYPEPLSGSNVAILTGKQESFLVGLMVRESFRKGLISYVSHNELKGFQMPRFMRDLHIVRGEKLGWHIVEVSTLKIRLEKKLSTEERRFSPFGVWNIALLKERIESGWTLDSWV